MRIAFIYIVELHGMRGGVEEIILAKRSIHRFFDLRIDSFCISPCYTTAELSSDCRRSSPEDYTKLQRYVVSI